jgi:RHS repeat-associated protein
LAQNIYNRPASVTVTGSGGSIVSTTLNAYDGSTLITSGATGIAQHCDGSPLPPRCSTNFDSSYTVRGNLTQVQQLISGTANYLTKSMTYDITGQMRSETDWTNSNTTTYSYADNLFTDAGDASPPSSYTPPTATNAYLNTITHPTVNSITLVDTFGYYWGTGQEASSLPSDPSRQPTYFHFNDLMNRPTSTMLPPVNGGSNRGWTYSVYPSGSETQVDTGIGITSTSLSVNCTGGSGDCRHDQTQLDGLGRVSSQILVSDPDGQTTVNTAYDSNGRDYSVSNPHRSSTSPTDGTEYYAYDGLDRKIQVNRADGSVAYAYYGAGAGSNGGRSSQVCSGWGVGYPVLTVDEAFKARQSWTDGFGRLIEVDEPDPSTGSLTSGAYAATCYAYDLNNNLTVVLQGSQTRNFSYDLLSRLTTATNPESGTINYYYTTSGGSLCSGDMSAICRRTDARSITTTYGYDALNRLISKSYSDSTPGVKYGYDGVAPSGCTPPTLTTMNGLGRRTSMCDGPGGTAWSYDSVGNALAEKRTTNSVTDTFTYTFNLDSTVATVAYPSTHILTYQPGGAQRSLWVLDTTNGINYAWGPCTNNTSTTGACYAPQGALSNLNNGSSLVSTSFYNSRLRPCRISVKNSGTAPSSCTDSSNTGNVMDLVYNFNSGSTDNGNVMGITNNIDTTRSQTFTYDSMNRIATAAASTYALSPTYCWGESYTIDRYGNLSTIGSISSAYTGCTQDTLSVSVSSSTNRITSVGSTSFTYDSSGNLTSDGTYSPSYDAEGRMISDAGVTYNYDGDGKRVRKSSGTLYWYGTNSDPLLETDGSGSLTNEYIFFGGKRTARRDSSGNVEYYISDHLGTTRIVTNASGTISEGCDYFPYGGSNCSPSSVNNYLFTGKERESESGLDDFGARYYSSQYGRFMTPDEIGPGQNPEDPQTWNMYSYVRNNPINLVDPTGQYICDGSMTQTECDRFQAGLDRAQTAADALKAKYGADSDQFKSAQRAIDAYGKAGIDNGVVIHVNAQQQDVGVTTVAGTTVAKTESNPTGQNISVSFKSGVLDNADSNVLATDEAHEGSHVADGSAWVASGFSPLMNPTMYKTEFDAFQVQSRIAEGLGYSLQFQDPKGGAPYNISIIHPNWTTGDTNYAIRGYLHGVYNLTPTSKLAAFSRSTKVTQ